MVICLLTSQLEEKYLLCSLGKYSNYYPNNLQFE
jgi:hypothetical protein